MKCTEAWRLMDEWVDGDLSVGETGRLEEHIEGCPACRAEAAELRQLLALAEALPREAAPQRELWGKISTGIEGQGRGGWRLPFSLGSPSLWAAAAAVVLAVGAMTVTTGRWGPSGDRPAAPQESAHLALAAHDPSFADIEADYERASADLLAAVESVADRLPAETVERVRRNLAVIDQARAEVHAALATDPGNPGLRRLLASTQQHKLELLQRVVRLSS